MWKKRRAEDTTLNLWIRSGVCITLFGVHTGLFYKWAPTCVLWRFWSFPQCVCTAFPDCRLAAKFLQVPTISLCKDTYSQTQHLSSSLRLHLYRPPWSSLFTCLYSRCEYRESSFTQRERNRSHTERGSEKLGENAGEHSNCQTVYYRENMKINKMILRMSRPEMCYVEQIPQILLPMLISEIKLIYFRMNLLLNCSIKWSNTVVMFKDN